MTLSVWDLESAGPPVQEGKVEGKHELGRELNSRMVVGFLPSGHGLPLPLSPLSQASPGQPQQLPSDLWLLFQSRKKKKREKRVIIKTTDSVFQGRWSTGD